MKKDLNIEKPATIKEIVVEAKLENLQVVQDFISEELEVSSSCTDEIKTQVIIAAEEIFVNIARYAYGHGMSEGSSQSEQRIPEVGTVTVRVGVSDKINIEYEDSGAPFNPLEMDDPDITLSIEERDFGGLGIFMAKNLMDVIEYRYKNNKNILLLIKNVKAS
ncbi:hypothetical protein FACS1894127_1870 [Clostridia bacterium]|nr:hypothetical protein FACS1894127_1870 [Clostridia bacterium]